MSEASSIAMQMLADACAENTELQAKVQSLEAEVVALRAEVATSKQAEAVARSESAAALNSLQAERVLFKATIEQLQPAGAWSFKFKKDYSGRVESIEAVRG